MSDPIGDAGGGDASSPVANADAFLGAGNQYSADAFEGDAGLSRDTYSASGFFDTPAGLPGFSMNTGVPGATVTPFELPVAGAHDADEFTSGLSPMSASGLASANDALPSNLMAAATGAISGGGAAPTPDMTQGIPPPGQSGGGFTGGPQAIPPAGALGFPGQPGAGDQLGGQGQQGGGQQGGGQQGGQQQQFPPIPPLQMTGGGGLLSANVPYADGSLISAVMSAGSGAGGQAALVADTVTLSGTMISTGGGSVGARNTPATALAPGSEAGSAPQFGGGGHWFYPTVQSWYDEMVERIMAERQAQMAAQQRQGGGGGGGGAPAGGGALGAGGAVGDDDGGGARPRGPGGAGGGDMFDTPLQQQAEAGLFDGKISGAIDNALTQWGAGQPDPAHPEDGMDPLHATFSNEQMTALGLDNPNAGFEGLGHDPVSNTGGVDPNHPADDMWSSPLGGMGNAASDPGDGLGLM